MSNDAQAVRSATGWFTQIANSALRDRRLSYRARGVLAACLTHAEGFAFKRAWIDAHGPEGRDAITKAMQELRDLGYCIDQFIHDKKGRLLRKRLLFLDTPGPQNPSDRAGFADFQGFTDSQACGDFQGCADFQGQGDFPAEKQVSGSSSADFQETDSAVSADSQAKGGGPEHADSQANGPGSGLRPALRLKYRRTEKPSEGKSEGHRRRSRVQEDQINPNPFLSSEASGVHGQKKKGADNRQEQPQQPATVPEPWDPTKRPPPHLGPPEDDPPAHATRLPVPVADLPRHLQPMADSIEAYWLEKAGSRSRAAFDAVVFELGLVAAKGGRRAACELLRQAIQSGWTAINYAAWVKHWEANRDPLAGHPAYQLFQPR